MLLKDFQLSGLSASFWKGLQSKLGQHELKQWQKKTNNLLMITDFSMRENWIFFLFTLLSKSRIFGHSRVDSFSKLTASLNWHYLRRFSFWSPVGFKLTTFWFLMRCLKQLIHFPLSHSFPIHSLQYLCITDATKTCKNSAVTS